MSNITSSPSETWTIQTPNPLASNLSHRLLANFRHATRIARDLCLLIVDMSPFLASSQTLCINQILKTSLSVLRSQLIILHSWGSKVLLQLFRIHWIVPIRRRVVEKAWSTTNVPVVHLHQLQLPSFHQFHLPCQPLRLQLKALLGSTNASKQINPLTRTQVIYMCQRNDLDVFCKLRLCNVKDSFAYIQTESDSVRSTGNMLVYIKCTTMLILTYD